MLCGKPSTTPYWYTSACWAESGRAIGKNRSANLAQVIKDGKIAGSIYLCVTNVHHVCCNPGMSTHNSAMPVIVTDHVTINAPASRVWKVLTTPNFIRQWDDLPEGFGDQPLQKGTHIEWEGFSKLTVAELSPEQRLKLKLYSPKWGKPPELYDIAYSYSLTENNGQTHLSLNIGDFNVLPIEQAETYQEASQEFAESALPKIKEIAEKMDGDLWDDTPRPDPLDV